MTEEELSGGWLSHERRVLLLAFFIGLPGSATALILLWTGAFTPKVQWTVTLFVVLLWIGSAAVLREWVVRPLQTLSNLLGALREGDFSIRARKAQPDDALGLALLEVNTLGSTLRAQRLGAVEASTLLRKVIAEIEVAVFAFDGGGRLKLVNRAGERLLGRPAERLLNRSADELGLAGTLEGDTPRTIDWRYPGGSGRWELRRTTFRQEGLRHQLVVLSDLSRALREEERQAWQRLVRVLGHEINNSLAPIMSLSESLERIVAQEPPPPDAGEDLRQGLGVIAGRAKALSRFMASYARLARLPAPALEPMEVRPWIERVAELETRLQVDVQGGPEMVIAADGDQLDQLLINLVTNAVDASIETGGRVAIEWRRRDRGLEVLVTDEGPGIGDSANLFVPFFTTKPHGSGIGLALSRQIAEAHGGTLTLQNRRDGAGCTARLVLPLNGR
ncbi:MAG TPA: ATP-binding protein [Longimicrobiales bacterium]|nr:ATP-binding protein [Longimicrobiales bacterium]